jgi:para-aminobenzoate synthetase component I
MRQPLPENYVIVPTSPGAATGNCYGLERTGKPEGRCFVIIPYSNPRVSEPQPQYYRITGSSEIDLELQEAGAATLVFNPVTAEGEYLSHVKALQQEIGLGNIYEINYCVQFKATEVTIDPVNVFAALNVLAKAPYAALVRLGSEYIISASPELFMAREGEKVFTKPIKGTARRGHNAEEDERLKNALHNSLKERTENVMAVDVARNDLSMFAAKGTVSVNRLYNIETYETVHQMVSTVSCLAKKGTDLENIIKCTFPMASMTGAPKQSAMDLIERHEQFKRGYYSGAMGMLEENGDFSLSVIIRSIFYNSAKRTIDLAAGGAITYLSDAEAEYSECLLKLRTVLAALNGKISS